MPHTKKCAVRIGATLLAPRKRSHVLSPPYGTNDQTGKRSGARIVTPRLTTFSRMKKTVLAHEFWAPPSQIPHQEERDYQEERDCSPISSRGVRRLASHRRNSLLEPQLGFSRVAPREPRTEPPSQPSLEPHPVFCSNHLLTRLDPPCTLRLLQLPLPQRQ